MYKGTIINNSKKITIKKHGHMAKIEKPEIILKQLLFDRYKSTGRQFMGVNT